MAYRKLSDAWRHKTGPQTLGDLGALGGVEVQIPNVAELKAKNFEAPASSNTEVSGERDRFNSINQSEPDSRIRPWGPPKPPKAPKVETQDEDAVWSDAQEEHAAIVEHDGGARRPWAEAMARLDPARVPANMSQERWAQFIDDCGRFLDQGWATHAEGLGWGPLDLFGCDRERSPAEGDHAGLLWRQAHHHVRICGHHRDGNRAAKDVSPSQQPSRRAGPGVGARSRPGAVRQPTPIYRGLRTSARPAVMPRSIMASIARSPCSKARACCAGRAGGRSTDTGNNYAHP